tara:strand:- start:264 stop:1205 length:942 start_codon:yes stop_codon:yes gene_type:complete
MRNSYCDEGRSTNWKNYGEKHVFSDLSATEDVLSENEKSQLIEDGFCIKSISPKEWMERGIDLDLISKVINELVEKEGWRGGYDHDVTLMKEGQHPEEGAQRLNNLLYKHECFRKVFTIPEILAASKLLIKDEINLSQMILRMPLPGTGEMPWHVDWIPRKKSSDPVMSVLNFLLLDDYTKENGTTRVIPGSHKFLKQPSDEGYYFQDHPDQKYVEAPRGSLILCDVNVWHAGTKNQNGKNRRHLNIHYRNRKIWQQINFKKTIPNKLKYNLTPAESYLLKVRDEDPSRNDWLFYHRNNFFVKKLMNFYWNLK